MTCCLLGHRDTSEAVKTSLLTALTDLIENESVTRFMVGEQGSFDRISLSILAFLKQKYPHISYYVVLAYAPAGHLERETIFPEGMEYAPHRFAIAVRNRWMIKNSDIVVAYVCRNYGGAWQALELARRSCKRIINLASIK